MVLLSSRGSRLSRLAMFVPSLPRITIENKGSDSGPECRNHTDHWGDYNGVGETSLLSPPTRVSGSGK